MTTVGPLVSIGADPPLGITVVIKADECHNPYLGTGFGGVGKSWSVQLTNQETKATFKLQVSTGSGVSDPPTPGQVCEALQQDIVLSGLSAEAIAERFQYPTDSHGIAEARFIKGVIERRAAGARSVGLNPVSTIPKRAQEPRPVRTEAPAAPAPAKAAKRTGKTISDAPAALPPPPPPPPAPPAGLASVLDF